MGAHHSLKRCVVKGNNNMNKGKSNLFTYETNDYWAKIAMLTKNVTFRRLMIRLYMELERPKRGDIENKI